MTTRREGMEAPGVPVDIQSVLDGHQEVLVIVADPDGSEGESTVAVFSKLLDRKSVITPMLANLLRNLLATTNGKQCSGITGKASASA